MEYSIQALIYLAEKDSTDPTMVSEVAKAYNIPHQFLAKITQTLVKHRLLSAVRGRKGGVMLAKPAKEIFLPQIIQAIEGPEPEEEQCVFGLDLCTDIQPCPLHHKWKVIREEIRDMMQGENLD